MLDKIRQFFSRMKERLSSKKKEDQELDWGDEPTRLPDQKDPTLTQKLSNLLVKLKSVKKDDILDPITQFEQETAKRRKKFSFSQIDYGELLNYINSPKFYSRFHHYFLTAFLLISFYTFGKIGALFIRGNVPTGIKLTQVDFNFNLDRELESGDITLIKKYNPFKTGTADKKADAKVAMKQKCDDADQLTSLPIKLKNTIVLQDSVKSIASIQVRSKSTKDFRQGEDIESLAKLERIGRLKIILKNLKTGACEFVENKEFEKGVKTLNVLGTKESKTYLKQKEVKGIKNEGNSFAIDRKIINEKLKDLSAVLTQARATPFKNPDGTMSFKIDQVEPGGIFATLGVTDGDTITKINGKSIENINEVMNLFGKIKDMANLNLTVTRDGSEETLDYTFK